MSNVRSIIRAPSLASYELADDTRDFLQQVEVTVDGVVEIPVFANDVPRVRHEKVVQPTGMPPSDWAVL